MTSPENDDQPATARLHTGAEVSAGLVPVLSLSFDALWAEHAVAVIDLVELARNGSEPFPPCAARLLELGITQPDGTLHAATRDVVLASFVGDGFDIHRVNPITGTAR